MSMTSFGHVLLTSAKHKVSEVSDFKKEIAREVSYFVKTKISLEYSNEELAKHVILSSVIGVKERT